ncbi:MAG TPA: C25 family cysteine peptidase [bacterium]
MKRIAILAAVFLGSVFAQSGARYLIITHDSYYDALVPLADWKTQKGMKAKIVRLSETGSDSTQIKSYIVNAYNNWQIKPEYLLLVGNPQQIPFVRFTYNYDLSYSDNYYANVVGDFYNELIPARLWVFDTVHVKTIVNKILGYEKTPFMDDPDWFRKAVTIANEDDYPPYSDSTYFADADYAHRLMDNASFPHVDSFSQYAGNNNSDDVIQAWNDGRTYILYRGVGGYYWDYPFYDIYPLTDCHNGYKMPIIISGTCATIEEIGYEWMYAGTPDEPKGAVGFYGTTDMLMEAAEKRSALAKGTLRNIFCDSMATLGKAAEWGRQTYVHTFGNTQEYNSWTCLGDPEMTVWTGTPRSLDVTHWPRVWIGESLIVTVKHDYQPVESALVCIRARKDTTVYHYRRTNASGTVTFIDTLPISDTALVTVTGRNLLPQTDTVLAGYQGGPSLMYDFHLVLDTTGGNGNYIPNNGEDIELAVWMLNVGDSTAHGVTAILEKAQADPYFQIADTIKAIGDIASLDSAFTSADGFNIIIDQYCPDSHLVKLKLVMTDADSHTWISFFNVLVYSARPYLIYMSHAVLDTANGTGNGDYFVNPAEDIEMPVWIKNIGDSIAVAVTGVIQRDTIDPYYTLHDTLKGFGNILPADTAWTGADGFNVLVDSGCPDQHVIKLRCTLSDALDSTWIYDIELINHSAMLVITQHWVNDTLKYVMPRDTAPLYLELHNIGSGIADSITGTLVCADSFFHVIDGEAYFGLLPPDGIGSNHSDPFLISGDSLSPAGHAVNLKIVLESGAYRDTLDFTVYIGQRDYVVWDPDPNHTSGFVMHTKLAALGYLGDYTQGFPAGFLNIYKVFFASLGMYPNKYTISYSNPDIFEIVRHLNAGGRMYLEGGDVWYNDPLSGGYDFASQFSIDAIQGNIGYFTGLIGVSGTFTNQMSFSYTGESSSIDRIDPTGNGIAVLRNVYNSNNCGVAANHRTVGISVEFGGMVDGSPPSTKLALADSIMRYFGILPGQAVGEGLSMKDDLEFRGLRVWPNPSFGRTVIKYVVSSKPQDSVGQGFSHAKSSKPEGLPYYIKIYDAAGRLVKSFNHLTIQPFNQITWTGADENGRRVPAGVYFVRLAIGPVGATGTAGEADGEKWTEKAILLR